MALAGTAVPAASASTLKPVLKVSGTTLTWTALPGVKNYLLATVRNPTTTRNTTYQVVTGTSSPHPPSPAKPSTTASRPT